jgi:hypothetical protein
MAATDWVQATDPASGDPYWWNEKTGESTWENPVPVAGITAFLTSADLFATREASYLIGAAGMPRQMMQVVTALLRFLLFIWRIQTNSNSSCRSPCCRPRSSRGIVSVALVAGRRPSHWLR